MLSRLLGRLFGSGGEAAAHPGEAAEAEQYQGFDLVARPVQEGSAWRVAGSIRRAGDEEGPSHDFVRADTLQSHEEAVRMSLLKARQIVDERGDAVLSGTE